MSTNNQFKSSVLKHTNSQQYKPKPKTQKSSPTSIISKPKNHPSKSKNFFGINTIPTKIQNKQEQKLNFCSHWNPSYNNLLLSTKTCNNLSPHKTSSSSLSNTKKFNAKNLKQIHFKSLYHKGITTPSTTKHSRKSSKEHSGSIYLKNKHRHSKTNNKHNFLIYNKKSVTSSNTRQNTFHIGKSHNSTNCLKKHQTQSTLLNKVKKLHLPNTNDFKILLSKYSIVNNISNASGNKHKHIKHSTNITNNFNMSKSYIKQLNKMKLSFSSYFPKKPLILQQSDLQSTFNIISTIQSSNTSKQNLKKYYPTQNRNNTNNNFITKDNSGYSLLQHINTSESKGKTVTKTISNISNRMNNNNTNELTKSKEKNNKKHTNNNNINIKLANKFNRKHILHNIDLIFVKYPFYSHTKSNTSKKDKDINFIYRSYHTQNNQRTNPNIRKKQISISSTVNPSFSNKRNSKSKYNKSITKTVLNNLSSPNHNLNTINKHINTLSTNTEIINYNNTHNEDSILNSSINQSCCSTIRESNYYYNESKHLSEMIINYMKTHKEKEYPKTTMKFYKVGRRIGHGGFGKVNIGLHILSGHIVAIKSFNKSKDNFSESKIQYEIHLMKKLRANKNIVKFFEDVHTDKHYCIIMENISGGNLLTLINKRTKLPEKTAKYIFKQLIETLKFIHAQNIAHRDIKPDNILIELNNTIKICDFGVSKEIKNGQLIYDPCGTPAFVAPEILGNSPYDPFKTDIWSCGVVLYSMVSGFFPFRGNNDYELHQSILNGEYPTLGDISIELKDLIDKILEVDVSKRITLNEMLNHKWLSSEIINVNEYEFTNLFTNAEKIIYAKLNVDYRCARKEDLMENFTYRNLISELENENQNNFDKSIVNAPFNTRIRPYIDYEDDVFFEDLTIENSLMKFLPKVQELNLNYEVNYNAEADQGIVKNSRKENRRIVMSSFNNSLILQQNKKPNINKDNNNISLSHSQYFDEEKLNQNYKTKETDCNENEGISDKNNNKEVNSHNVKIQKKIHKDTLSTSSNTFYIDDHALKFVEDFGFKKEYILKSLENNETNHATATYYLKLSLLNE